MSAWNRDRVRPLSVVACVLIGLIGCRDQSGSSTPSSPSTLRIGFGLGLGTGDSNGLNSMVRQLGEETLVAFSADGRPQPWLADRWTVSDDRLTWTIHIRNGVRFHSGRPLTGELLTRIMEQRLPNRMGIAFKNVRSIRPLDEETVQVVVMRPSSLFLDSLDFAVIESEGIGTAAYKRTGSLELVANDAYWGPKPAIDRILFQPYDSVRAAWADMLRGELDMLFQVGGDAYESLSGSNEIRLFEFQRRYAYEVILNITRPALASPEVRRRLNAAIDRKALVADGMGGHGQPEHSPLWPGHWAQTPGLPTVEYRPVALDERLRFTCLFVDGSIERLALSMQRQLAAIGVEVMLERVSLDTLNERVPRGDFDALLVDAQRGASLQRGLVSWSTGNVTNYGHYSNRDVDSAIDAIHASTNDEGYRRGYAALARALVDDPPSIYLAWGRSLRAVSSRFNVHVDPARDVMYTIPLWRVGPTPPTATH